MSLDVTLLEKVRRALTGKITARCAACVETGGDRKGSHLVIFPDERFACAAHPGDGGHRRRVMALTGIRSGEVFDPSRRRQWRQERSTALGHRAHDRVVFREKWRFGTPSEPPFPRS
jgi:hypothetical protein